MLQSILAIAALFPARWRTKYTDVGRLGATRPDRASSPRDRDAATRLADRALCGIDMPLVF